MSERVAYLMAAGPGESSRIYKTEDGGATWSLQFTNRDPAAFCHCFAFWTPTSRAAWSPDEGDQWQTLPGVENYWAVAFASPQAGWLVGTEGRILKIGF